MGLMVCNQSYISVLFSQSDECRQCHSETGLISVVLRSDALGGAAGTHDTWNNMVPRT